MNFKTDCKHGDFYPAMMNGPMGSEALNLKCYHLGDRRLLTFPMTDGSVETLIKGGEIGFAFPLDGGKFGVSRFSLYGRLRAVDHGMRIIVKRRETNQEGLRDFTI